MDGFRRVLFCGRGMALLGFCLLLPVGSAGAEPTPQQEAWWWQDEIREAAFALSRSRSGEVSRWPQIAVAAGSMEMPIPWAASPIRADGKLDEPAWQQATTFPVGPVFDTWCNGPFMLQVSVCRDEKSLLLAVRSPRDLTDLGDLSVEAALFRVGGRGFRVGEGGGLPDGAVAADGCGQVIELALPLADNTTLAFPVEVARRVKGSLSSGYRDVGLDRLSAPPTRRPNFRRPSLWLTPITVRLRTADVSVRVEASRGANGRPALHCRRQDATGEAETNTLDLKPAANSGVYPYVFQTGPDGRRYSAEGFLYVEPVAATIDAATAISERVRAAGSRRADPFGSHAAIDDLGKSLERTSPGNAAAWRQLYCRARAVRAQEHLRLLDAPLLLVKRHPYFAGHIYDDYYTWHPGGGIYLLRHPHDPSSRNEPTLRAIIDQGANETLGNGVYRDPEVSWDGRRVLFAYKPEAAATTNLYEIDIDGRGLRRLTTSDKYHDITPAYLPDGRIAFTSTRPKALVPCFNSGVDTLHVMNSDGSGIRSISSNNVTEFDPAVMPDGRLLYGRWEYVDKTALYMQSLWTMLPDGRMEEALFANNLARPTAVLDARPVPGTHLIAASLSPHNGQAVGAIGMIDVRRGKNDLEAVANFTPEYPIEMDQGLRSGPSDPMPLSADDALIASNAVGAHGVIELVDRQGHRELVYCDPEISCYAPMLVKPRTPPAVVSTPAEADQPGRFLLVDVYQGLSGVARGTVKKIRVVEETARTSGIPPGGRWWNQAFLVSWQGAYIVKSILGTVPVEEDGSAYFEVPAGRAVYFEALDADGREIQRMRTFVQTAPGVTRSCIGCHENKNSAPLRPQATPIAALSGPVRPERESWGSGFIDYPTMIQPILDKHCVRCHGGAKGMAKGLDFSGGWTWAFSISYETLIKHRLTGFLNCHNSSVHTSEILPPRTIGSGAAPLAEILIKKHPELSPAERDVMLAWMDTNSNYYGTWDYTPQATCDAILTARAPLIAAMRTAGCNECHAAGHIGNDWINLQTPEWSRILRAPLAKTPDGLGLAMCRKRKARQGYPLVTQRVQPPDVVKESLQPEWDPAGVKHVSFTSEADPQYQAMLSIIRHTRGAALARPRIDMPGAEAVGGQCRIQVPMPVPDAPPELTARLRSDGAVELAWQRTFDTIGLQYELHRGAADGFALLPETQIGLTTAGRFVDLLPPEGPQHYALVVTSGKERSRPVFASIEVRAPEPPPAPGEPAAEALPGEITLRWEGTSLPGIGYEVYRAKSGEGRPAKITAEPLAALSYADLEVEPGVKYTYHVRAVDRRGQQSEASSSVEATPLSEIKEPVFATDFSRSAAARRLNGKTIGGKLHAGAKVADGCLQLGETGWASFAHQSVFDVRKAFSVECWVRIDREAQMPVVSACGRFGADGWFLQRYGRGWRWHIAPASCDGGRPVAGQWTHLVGTFDGTHARLYQDGKLAATVACVPNRLAYKGPLILGQYTQQSENYQVTGAISGVKIYQRALGAKEVARQHEAGRGV